MNLHYILYIICIYINLHYINLYFIYKYIYLPLCPAPYAFDMIFFSSAFQAKSLWAEI